MARDGRYSTNSLAFLCWLDTFERIDTLLLEIRHVQETIASQLREPQFYEPLRYEDHYLWGRYSKSIAAEPITSNDWSEVLSSPRLPSCSAGCSVLAAYWCPEFPPVPDEETYFERLQEDKANAFYAEWVDVKAHDECREAVYRKKKELSTVNLFSANEDRLYDSLRYLQLLKRDILRDKLVLAYRALETFAWPIEKLADDKRTDDERDDERLTRFLIVRRAAMHSLHLRLDAFRDILSAVQEILNLSIERDPPPTVRRRRDQGIYTTDLADNCRFIERDVKNFFEAVGGGTPVAVDKRVLEFIVHRYTRNYTSTHRYEDIWTSTPPGGREQRQIGAGFVLSSFWMPERPDLQPIIAHEVAHLILKSKRQDLRPRAVDGSNDSLTELLRKISYIFELYSKRFKYLPFRARTRENLLREIACDLVGSAVHRTSYLFANFLELLCFGCEAMFQATQEGDIAYDVSELGEEYITFIRDRLPEWTIRLQATWAFSNALRIQTRRPAQVLEASIHAGIKGAIDAVCRQLFRWMDGEQREDWGTWLEMTNVVAELVKDARLVNTTSEWIRLRIADSESKEKRRWNDPRFNRYLPRLPASIVEDCLGSWLDRLVEVPRMLGRTLNQRIPSSQHVEYNDILRIFRELYLDTPALGIGRPELGLFNHLIDIPWQIALLTARDFLGRPRGRDPNIDPLPYDRWIASIHEFNWLGRDLYEFALEYAVWYERPSIGRLRGMNRWLISILKSIEKLLKEQPDEMLATLQRLLHQILYRASDAGSAIDPSPDFEKLIEKWLPHGPLEKWPQRELHLSDHIGLGSLAISEHYPNNDRHTVAPRQHTKASSQHTKEEWIHFFDYMAMRHMDDAGEKISATVTDLIKTNKSTIRIQDLAEVLKRPIEPAIPEHESDEQRQRRRRLVQYGLVIFELIRVAHYLEIRPEKWPGGPTTGHHISDGALAWSKVFARYLNVPIQARKRSKGSDSKHIIALVPTRSLRVDRLSQLYHAHLSSLAMKEKEKDAHEHPRDADKKDTDECIEYTRSLEYARKYPGHLADDNFIPGRELYWIPWSEHGVRPIVNNEQDRVTSTRLGTPLLGRFDRLMIEPAKNTARFRQYAPSIPYFRRQQIGLPFAATIASGKIGRAEEHTTFPLAFRNVSLTTTQNALANPNKIPLATISILLVQRSARLTFVERLLAEDLVMKSFYKELSSPYQYFNPCSDIGLLTDGWGDIFLILFGTLDGKTPKTFEQYVDRCRAVRTRFDEIITLRKSIFEDTLVVRSETSYTPLAIDTALLHPRQFRCTISVRFKATRDGTSLSEAFENHLYDVFHKKYNYDIVDSRGNLKKATLWDILSYSSISGRNDYVITSRQSLNADPVKIYEQLFRGDEDYSGYGIIFETLRRIFFEPKFISEHVDTTTTTIGELQFPKY
jgi:hypothetical protein